MEIICHTPEEAYMLLWPVAHYQCLLAPPNPSNQPAEREYQELINKLRPSIILLGGIEKIDQDLLIHKPDRKVCADIPGLNFDWLNFHNKK